MEIFVVLALCLGVAVAIPSPIAQAAECTAENCKLASGCVCSSTVSPLTLAETPQLVAITFDESIMDLFYTKYYEPLFFNRKNPTGDYISGTFYVPHVYTDYERLNHLYNKGFEIGAHSVTKNALVDYWAQASLAVLTSEFKDQKTIISKYANIPADHIQGARIPYLQLAGNITIQALINAGLSYDNSWTTASIYYPYTLDYLSTQDCIIGVCPNEPFKGFWIAPVINLKDQKNNNCNALSGCQLDDDVTGIYNWLVAQFNRVHKGNKAPFTIMLSSAWFQIYKHSYDAFAKFLDYLGSQKDVFLVSQREVLDWRKNPKKIAEFKPLQKTRNATCNAITCPLQFGESEIRYMRSCVAKCPDAYPWLNNPDGKLL